MERKPAREIVEREKIIGNVDILRKTQKQRAEKRLPSFYEVAGKSEDKDLKTLFKSLKKLYGSGGYFSEPKESLGPLGDSLFHRGITVLLDHAVSELWKNKISAFKKPELSKGVADELDKLIDKIPIAFSELADEPGRVGKVHEFIQSLDLSDSKLLKLEPVSEYSRRKRLVLQKKIEELTGGSLERLLALRKQRRADQLNHEEFFETDDLLRRIGTIVVPFSRYATVGEDIDTLYQKNQRWKRRLNALNETDISESPDYKKFHDLFLDAWHIFEHNPYIMQAFNVYFNRISERWVKQKLDKIIPEPPEDMKHELDSFTRSITHLARAPRLLKRVFRFLKSMEGKPKLEKEEDMEKFVSDLEDIITSQKYRSKTGKKVHFAPPGALIHQYREQRHIQTGEIDHESEFMKRKVKEYRPEGPSKKALKNVFDRVFEDPELSTPQIMHVISSVLKKPLDRETSKYVTGKFRKRGEAEAALSKIIRMSLDLPISGLDLLMKIADTDECKKCRYRDSKTMGRTANELVRGFKNEAPRKFKVCDIVQAGATQGKAIKPHCLSKLWEVQEGMEKILGRPVEPNSEEDQKILERVLKDGQHVVEYLDWLGSKVMDPSFEYTPESLPIEKDSLLYPLYYPVYRHMMNALKEKEANKKKEENK